jgi:four helix bundle protein
MTQRSPLRSHEDLQAYQSSMQLLVRVHEVCRSFPPDEKYELVSQMRRASKSVPANIAEGFSKRATVNDFKRYLRSAMGSANEMETHLKIAGSLGYLSDLQLSDLTDGYNHVGRQLNRLISNWRDLS